MIVYDINLKEISTGDSLRCGNKKYIIETKNRIRFVKMGKIKYTLKELSHYEINKSTIVLYDFTKIEKNKK
jgi:hypothetical protein